MQKNIVKTYKKINRYYSLFLNSFIFIIRKVSIKYSFKIFGFQRKTLVDSGSMQKNASENTKNFVDIKNNITYVTQCLTIM